MHKANAVDNTKHDKSFRLVCIQKVDLDTALTALLLEVSKRDKILYLRKGAAQQYLADADVICIETGGSGQIELQNFDHHQTEKKLPSASRQAFEAKRIEHCPTGNMDSGAKRQSQHNFDGIHSCPVSLMRQLVDYVDALDRFGPRALQQQNNCQAVGFPTLSHLFSGMLLITPDPVKQLFRGIDILKTVLRKHIDPFSLMPALPEWTQYLAAKQQEEEKLEKAAEKAMLFKTDKGKTVGYVESSAIGVGKALRRRGCDIIICYSDTFGSPPRPKFTISSDDIQVSQLLPELNYLEPGWGGPATGTIIGSPHAGTNISPKRLRALVKSML